MTHNLRDFVQYNNNHKTLRVKFIPSKTSAFSIKFMFRKSPALVSIIRRSRRGGSSLIDCCVFRKSASPELSVDWLKTRVNDARRSYSTSIPVSDLSSHHDLQALCRDGGTKFDVSVIAQPIRAEVKRYTAELIRKGEDLPTLLVLLANENSSSVLFSDLLSKYCNEDGINLEVARVDESEVEDALHAANVDSSVNSVIVCYPIFDAYETTSLSKFCRLTGEYLSRDDKLRDNVSPMKDAEGLGHVYNRPHSDAAYISHPENANDATKEITPCSAEAVMKCLSAVPGVYNEFLPHTKRMDGLTVTIVNRSPLYGHPLAVMLSNEGAEVYSIALSSTYHFKDFKYHKIESELENCIKSSNVVITGVPDPNFSIPGEWIQPQTIVLNMSEYENISENSVLQVPGTVLVTGVGKLTRSLLERNVIRLHEAYHRKDFRIHKENARQSIVAPEKESMPLGVAVSAFISRNLLGLS